MIYVRFILLLIMECCLFCDIEECSIRCNRIVSLLSVCHCYVTVLPLEVHRLQLKVRGHIHILTPMIAMIIGHWYREVGSSCGRYRREDVV